MNLLRRSFHLLAYSGDPRRISQPSARIGTPPIRTSSGHPIGTVNARLWANGGNWRGESPWFNKHVLKWYKHHFHMRFHKFRTRNLPWSKWRSRVKSPDLFSSERNKRMRIRKYSKRMWWAMQRKTDLDKEQSEEESRWKNLVDDWKERLWKPRFEAH